MVPPTARSIRPAIDESMDLENRIVATRATTRAELAAKRRFIKRTEFIGSDHIKGCATGCLYGLVDMILELDAERVGAAR